MIIDSVDIDMDTIAPIKIIENRNCIKINIKSGSFKFSEVFAHSRNLRFV